MFTDFVIPGILVGIGSAVSPGPILLLIISETLRGGIRSGWSVAVAPLITDIPFIIVSILLAKGIGSFQPLVGAISLIGAGFLMFLAYQNIKVQKEDLRKPSSGTRSLLKGVTLNLVSPYLYIFWFSVALPVFARGNMVGSASFAASLLVSAVGSMMILAALVAFIRTRFLDYLHWIIRSLSVLLFLVAIMFIREGFKLLSILPTHSSLPRCFWC